MPPHFRGADERKVVDPFVRGQSLSERIVNDNGAGPPFREATFVKSFEQIKTGEGRVERGRDDYRAADGHRRYHLVNGEVKRMIKGRDGYHNTYRFPDGKRHPV